MLVAKWCILVSLGIIYITRIFVARAQARVAGGYDNRMPREQQTHLDDAGKRAHAAHYNGFESFAPFAAAVLLAAVQHQAGRPVDPSMIDGFALGHVGCRVVYTGLYIADKPMARSTVWTLGFVCVVAIFVIALFA